MADAVDETERLFARANAAIAEAARLAEESFIQRKSLGERIRLMRLRAMFYPRTERIYLPTDFLFRLDPPQPCPNQISGNRTIEESNPIFDPHVDNLD
jgi:hypothetical protein